MTAFEARAGLAASAASNPTGHLISGISHATLISRRMIRVGFPKLSQLKTHLQVQPELRRASQRHGELYRHRSRNAAFFIADRIDDADLNPQVLRELRLRDAVLIAKRSLDLLR